MRDELRMNNIILQMLDGKTKKAGDEASLGRGGIKW
jgi:hypothetical protein